jgi:hypothetical protein
MLGVPAHALCNAVDLEAITAGPGHAPPADVFASIREIVKTSR